MYDYVQSKNKVISAHVHIQEEGSDKKAYDFNSTRVSNTLHIFKSTGQQQKGKATFDFHKPAVSKSVGSIIMSTPEQVTEERHMPCHVK